MSTFTRNLTLTGNGNSDADLMIKPAKVYVSLDPQENPTENVYDHVGYTSEQVTISLNREYARLMQDGATAVSACISKELLLDLELKQVYNPDLLAIALGQNKIVVDEDPEGVNDPTYWQIDIDSFDGEHPQYAWKVVSETYDGRAVECVIYKGSIVDSQELTLGAESGATEFAGVNLSIEANNVEIGQKSKLGKIRVYAPVVE